MKFAGAERKKEDSKEGGCVAQTLLRWLKKAYVTAMPGNKPDTLVSSVEELPVSPRKAEALSKKSHIRPRNIRVLDRHLFYLMHVVLNRTLEKKKTKAKMPIK